jgi:selT/selW/selH-like putative selenoprotein
MPTEKPRIEIEYCTQCRWLLRAAWMAQELLTTFEAEIGEVALMPGDGGVFEVRTNGATVWGTWIGRRRSNQNSIQARCTRFARSRITIARKTENRRSLNSTRLPPSGSGSGVNDHLGY